MKRVPVLFNLLSSNRGLVEHLHDAPLIKAMLPKIGRVSVPTDAANKEKCRFMDDLVSKFSLLTAGTMGNIFEELNLVLSKFDHLTILLIEPQNLLKPRLKETPAQARTL